MAETQNTNYIEDLNSNWLYVDDMLKSYLNDDYLTQEELDNLKKQFEIEKWALREDLQKSLSKLLTEAQIALDKIQEVQWGKKKVYIDNRPLMSQLQHYNEWTIKKTSSAQKQVVSTPKIAPATQTPSEAKKTFQSTVTEALQDGNLSPKELKDIIEAYSEEKAKLKDKTKAELDEFLKRNTRTMMEGKGFPIWSDWKSFERDVKILEKVWYDVSWLLYIINKTHYDPKRDGERYVWLAQWADKQDNRLFLRRDWEGTWYRTSDIDLVYTKDIKVEYEEIKQEEKKTKAWAKTSKPKADSKKPEAAIPSWRKAKSQPAEWTKSEAPAKSEQKAGKTAEKWKANPKVKSKARSEVWGDVKASAEIQEWTAVVNTKKSWLNFRDADWNVVDIVAKWTNLQLTWESKKMRWLEYVWVKLASWETGFVAKKYLLIWKWKAEAKESAPDITKAREKLEKNLWIASDIEKRASDTQDNLKLAKDKLIEAISKAKIIKENPNATIEEINLADSKLEEAIKKYNEALAKVKVAVPTKEAEVKKSKYSLDMTSIKSKVDKWDTVEILNYKITTIEDNLSYEDQGAKQDPKTWKFQRENIYSNTFEIYKKWEKYRLERNGSWVFSDDYLEFDSFPNESQIESWVTKLTDSIFKKDPSAKLEVEKR